LDKPLSETFQLPQSDPQIADLCTVKIKIIKKTSIVPNPQNLSSVAQYEGNVLSPFSEEQFDFVN